MLLGAPFVLGAPWLVGDPWLVGGPRQLGDTPPQAQLSSPAFPGASWPGLRRGGRPRAPQTSPGAGGGRLQPPASGTRGRSGGGWRAGVRSSLHVLSSERRTEPPPRCAMQRGRALGAWVLLASLAVASWGVQGKSPGISLCPQAAAVPCPTAEMGVVPRRPMRDVENPGVVRPRGPVLMVRLGLILHAAAGPQWCPLGTRHHPWKLPPILLTLRRWEGGWEADPHGLLGLPVVAA